MHISPGPNTVYLWNKNTRYLWNKNLFKGVPIRIYPNRGLPDFFIVCFPGAPQILAGQGSLELLMERRRIIPVHRPRPRHGAVEAMVYTCVSGTVNM